jgi:hypothetical protein
VEAQYGRFVGGQRPVIMIDPGTVPTGTSIDDWKKLDRKAKSTI